ncbi:MAG: hypothetical protein E6R03_12570 [Hyphomicrobiaceae bacterium]|nr:MAG: hypothetical protein E6R03_12570 [Hyphomicrobiaceae bacterium]
MDHQTIFDSEAVALGVPYPSYPEPGWARGNAKTAAFTASPGQKYQIDLNGASGNIVATLPATVQVGQKVGFWIKAGHATRKLVITAGSAIIAAPGASLATTHNFPYGTNSFEYIEMEFNGSTWTPTKQTWFADDVINP